MADVDLSEVVWIRNTDNGALREIPRGAVPFFVNSEQPWELLDAAGRRKAQQSLAADSTTSKES